MSDWLTFPIVSAPSPDDRSKVVHYKVCDEFCSLNAAINKKTPIFQLWTHVVGQLPPIHNVSRLNKAGLIPQLCTLNNSVECFRGVKRPYDDEEDGASILIYVINVDISIAYEPSMVCLAKAVKLPPSTPLTIQVRPTERLQLEGIDVTGTITRIEPVFGTEGTPSLPVGHAERYGERLWR